MLSFLLDNRDKKWIKHINNSIYKYFTFIIIVFKIHRSSLRLFFLAELLINSSFFLFSSRGKKKKDELKFKSSAKKNRPINSQIKMNSNPNIYSIQKFVFYSCILWIDAQDVINWNEMYIYLYPFKECRNIKPHITKCMTMKIDLFHTYYQEKAFYDSISLQRGNGLISSISFKNFLNFS